LTRNCFFASRLGFAVAGFQLPARYGISIIKRIGASSTDGHATSRLATEAVGEDHKSVAFHP
jgi:hypothetical protein